MLNEVPVISVVTFSVNKIRKAIWALSERGKLSLRRMDSLLCLFGKMLVKWKSPQKV